MHLPEVFRFPRIGWVCWHLVAIPLVFAIGWLFCSWQFGAPSPP